ncbi:MAG TPA: hypothetical protein VEF34_17445 [Syntrophobacteraceae bacterium]|nr:hypothetical protein [Syntrophobacteraceae bacterium]
MSLPEKGDKTLAKKLLNLESDLPLGQPQAMEDPGSRHTPDLAAYITWLEEIGAFKTRKADPAIYPERFEL